MPEKPLLCLGEAWLELTADTPPELAGQFQVQVGGWGAGLCRAYTHCGGRAVLLSQLGADPFGRKAAAQLAADREHARKLMEPDDDDLKMAPGQKIVIAAVVGIALVWLLITDIG